MWEKLCFLLYFLVLLLGAMSVQRPSDNICCSWEPVLFNRKIRSTKMYISVHAQLKQKLCQKVCVKKLWSKIHVSGFWEQIHTGKGRTCKIPPHRKTSSLQGIQTLLWSNNATYPIYSNTEQDILFITRKRALSLPLFNLTMFVDKTSNPWFTYEIWSIRKSSF